MLPHPAAAVVKDRMRRLQPDDVARHANNGPDRVIHDVTPNVVAPALCLHQGISMMFRKLGLYSVSTTQQASTEHHGTPDCDTSGQKEKNPAYRGAW